MDDEELVRRVFNVQKISTCKNDWVLQIAEDLGSVKLTKMRMKLKK